MMRRKRLYQAGLTVGASSEHRALDGVRAAAPQYHIDGAMHVSVFAWRSSRLHGICHFRKLAFLLLLRQWTDVVFKMLFGGRDRFHNLTVEQATQGFYVRNLRMILEPHRMREATPRQCKLRLNAAGHDRFVALRARPGFVLVLFQVACLGRDPREDRLRGTKGRHALE